MSSHFKWYPGSEEVVVPWNARYSFPTQANKAVKITPRIPPKNGATFIPGSVIRLEFPAQGYVNPANTSLSFDVTLQGYGTCTNEVLRFQNNIQSIFSRARLLYGSTPLEDVMNYNVIVRALTEWTTTDQMCTMDQTSISEGIGGFMVNGTFSITPTTPNAAVQIPTYYNVRQKYIHGSDQFPGAAGLVVGSGIVPAGSGLTSGASVRTVTRRYQIQLALGLFTQAKLIPTKFMASQLAIELTLASEAQCMFVQTPGSGASPTYSVSNVNLIPEILEFDSSYDEMFLKGLREGGVPIKFSSWHTYVFSTGGSSTANLQIQERSRSVKAIFTVQRRAPADLFHDAGTLHFDSSAAANGSPASASTLQSFQYRVGGRYFPAAPVQCGTTYSNGGAEAFVELQKALNVLGDYRLSAPVNALRWAVPTQATFGGAALTSATYQEGDYTFFMYGNGSGQAATSISPSYSFTGGGQAGNLGSSCFAMATSLESSNGVEISGLNAEEQSDISLIATWSSAQQSTFNFETYVYYDAMIVLRENNVLELIQ